MDQELAYGIENLIRFYQAHHGLGWATIGALILIPTIIKMAIEYKNKMWFYKK